MRKLRWDKLDVRCRRVVAAMYAGRLPTAALETWQALNAAGCLHTDAHGVALTREASQKVGPQDYRYRFRWPDLYCRKSGHRLAVHVRRG